MFDKKYNYFENEQNIEKKKKTSGSCKIWGQGYNHVLMWAKRFVGSYPCFEDFSSIEEDGGKLC